LAVQRQVYLRPALHLLLGVWTELRAPQEWLRLRKSAVFKGIRLPKGDGSPVILIPGFLGDDSYLNDLYGWLLRIGYRPYFAGIGRNSECPEILVERLLFTINRVHVETFQKVVLLGHSLGGTIAISAAIRDSGKISKIITLGSPIHSAGVNPLVFVTASVLGSFIRTRGNRLENCYTDSCQCRFVKTLRYRLPKDVTAAAIYTREDKVVRWQCTVWPYGEGINFRVSGTHLGLAFNPQAYLQIAQFLGKTVVKERASLRVVA